MSIITEKLKKNRGTGREREGGRKGERKREREKRKRRKEEKNHHFVTLNEIIDSSKHPQWTLVTDWQGTGCLPCAKVSHTDYLMAPKSGDPKSIFNPQVQPPVTTCVLLRSLPVRHSRLEIQPSNHT